MRRRNNHVWKKMMLTGIALTAAYVVLTSLPDVGRYIKIKMM